MRYISRILVAALIAAAAQTHAQGTWNVIPIPGVFYMPETSVGFAAYALGTWTPDDDGLKSHVYRGGAVYTLKNQVSLLLGSEDYFAGDNLRLATELSFARFPDVYYGIGPHADLEEDYTSQEVRLAVSAGWRVARWLYVGPIYRFSFSSLVDTEQGGALADAGVVGSGDFGNSGAGLLAVWDSRDSAVYPRSGQLVTVEATGYPRQMGSTEDWVSVRIDARSYHRIFREHVIALQAVAGLTGGDVPFRELPRIGGDSLLRGYYDGRYRDKTMVALQTEYRFPIAWRIGGVAFAGAGQVAEKPSDLSLDSLKVAGGAGLRFLLEKKEHVNLRLDLGQSLDGGGFYLQVTEAF